jgi:hypothetical protein
MRVLVLATVLVFGACVTSGAAAKPDQHYANQEALEHMARAQQDAARAHMIVMQMTINDSVALQNAQVQPLQ